MTEAARGEVRPSELNGFINILSSLEIQIQNITTQSREFIYHVVHYQLWTYGLTEYRMYRKVLLQTLTIQ